MKTLRDNYFVAFLLTIAAISLFIFPANIANAAGHWPWTKTTGNINTRLSTPHYENKWGEHWNLEVRSVKGRSITKINNFHIKHNRKNGKDCFTWSSSKWKTTNDGLCRNSFNKGKQAAMQAIGRIIAKKTGEKGATNGAAGKMKTSLRSIGKARNNAKSKATITRNGASIAVVYKSLNVTVRIRELANGNICATLPYKGQYEYCNRSKVKVRDEIKRAFRKQLTPKQKQAIPWGTFGGALMRTFTFVMTH